MRNPTPVTKLLACIAACVQWLSEKRRSVAVSCAWLCIILACGYFVSYGIYRLECLMGVA